MFLGIIGILVLSSSKISLSSFTSRIKSEKEFHFKPVIAKMIESGADSSFVYMLITDKRTNFSERFIKVNVTGYLKKTDYSHNYSNYSVKKSRDFICDNLKILNECEKKYGVPKEIIASIIWIETKNGTFLGDNHIPSVFLSAAMANESKYVELNKKELRRVFSGDSSELAMFEKLIENRSEKKANWALGELLALEKLARRTTIQVGDLRGSWAGAFGLPQFLPSSYIRWAVDGNGDGIIDLFDVVDAVHSVANYLVSNGWGKSREEKRKALFHYNNSNDYVDAVLTLANKLKEYDIKYPLNKQVR